MKINNQNKLLIGAVGFLMLLALTMVAGATYKEIKVDEYNVSFDIKGDPVTPTGEKENVSGEMYYNVYLQDSNKKNLTLIQISRSNGGIKRVGRVAMLLCKNFKDVQSYSREIDGHIADVGTGIGSKTGKKETVFTYDFGPTAPDDSYTCNVLVYCSLSDTSADDLMNTLHIGMPAQIVVATGAEIGNDSNICVIGSDTYDEKYIGCLVKSFETEWPDEQKSGPYSFDFDTGIKKYSFIGKDPIVYIYGYGSEEYLGTYKSYEINIYGLGFIEIDQYEKEVNASSVETTIRDRYYGGGMFESNPLRYQTIDGRPGFLFTGLNGNEAWYLLDNSTIVKIRVSQGFYKPQSVGESIFENTIKTIHIQRIPT
jgi:hypothetical protein